MKKNSLLMIAIALILSSCGIASQYTSASNGARFQDGIYSSSPSFRSRMEKAESRTKTDALVEETKASQIYLFGEKKDTVMIPQNMSASIRYDKSLASTVVTVGENPYAWQYDLDSWYYYTPYSIGSSWYWSRHYDPWYSSSWYWNTWAYSPWRYHGWYDPYYYGGWYDPWYYGYPYYCGWYGGWDPYWGHHHHHYFPGGPAPHRDEWHGSRHQSSSNRVFTSRVSTRGGTSSSKISRNESGTGASRVATSSNPTGSRPTATRVSATAGRTSSVKNSGTVSRTPATTPNRTGRTGTVSNHRKPAGTSVGTSSGSSTVRSSSPSTSRSYRTGGSSSSSSSYNRSSGSPTYRSTSTPSSSRSSSYSSGGSSRSYSSGSSSSSGGSSRSSGGSHRR